MPLILAIEPDRRQGTRIASLARDQLIVELVVVESVEGAIAALDQRIPDLILTSLMLSGKDEAVLDERLRQLDAAGSHVQTLMIPVLASSNRRAARGKGLLHRLRSKKAPAAEAEGCDPSVFAAQIAEYLERAADDRAALAVMAEDHQPLPDLVEEDRLSEPPEAPAAEADIAEALATAFVESPDVHEHEPQVLAIVEPLDVSESQAAASVEPRDVSAFLESLDVTEPHAAVIVEALYVSEPASVVDEPDGRQTVLAEFDAFVTFEELGLVDVPSVSFGELAGVDGPSGPSARGATWLSKSQPLDGLEVDDAWEAELSKVTELDEATTLEASAVIDALEILDEPEIPATIELELVNRPDHAKLEPDPPAADVDFESDLWMPLPVASEHRWPALEGPSVRARFAAQLDVPPDPAGGVTRRPASSAQERAAAKKAAKSDRPFQDEWGFFDPVQCGFAALLAKLDEVTDKEDSPTEAR
jgi:CheY-like chemotaxis protein